MKKILPMPGAIDNIRTVADRNFALLSGGFEDNTVGNITITRDSQGRAQTIKDGLSTTALTRNSAGEVTVVTKEYAEQTIKETINRDSNGTVTSITREVM